MRKVVYVASSLCVLVCVAAGSGKVMAADLDWRREPGLKDEPIVVPRYGFSWTGFYLGGNLGYSWGSTLTSPGAGDPFDGAGGFVIHPSGWVGGIQGGYNWQMDNVLAGFEADLGVLGASDGQHGAAKFAEIDYGAYGALTGRLGLVNDRWLFYFKGGLALAEIENRAGAFSATDITDVDTTRLGWTLGGGAEFAFTPDWSMKFEYMYMDFGQDSSGNADGDTFHHDNSLHTVKVGVNYHFPAPVPLR
jgi:outer membrane immunogenic protein